MSKFYTSLQISRISSTASLSILGDIPSGFEFIYPKNDGYFYHVADDYIERKFAHEFLLNCGLTYSSILENAIAPYGSVLSLNVSGGLTFSNCQLIIGSVTASQISTDNSPSNGNVLGFNGSGLTWTNKVNIDDIAALFGISCGVDYQVTPTYSISGGIYNLGIYCEFTGTTTTTTEAPTTTTTTEEATTTTTTEEVTTTTTTEAPTTTTTTEEVTTTTTTEAPTTTTTTESPTTTTTTEEVTTTTTTEEVTTTTTTEEVTTTTTTEAPTTTTTTEAPTTTTTTEEVTTTTTTEEDTTTTTTEEVLCNCYTYNYSNPGEYSIVYVDCNNVETTLPISSGSSGNFCARSIKVDPENVAINSGQVCDFVVDSYVCPETTTTTTDEVIPGP